jgi:tRNA nucleotidyltransferase (CCA-adding enzyme)
MKIYRVGGCIRDQLLGLSIKDIDYVVTAASVEEMLDLGYKPVGRDFPVFLHPDTKQEYALARSERKVSAGYGGFQFNTNINITIEQDLARRDLTINAIAEDSNGEIIDPYNGIADLNARILRHVSPAFVEDPVRVLRLARFAARFHALGFSIADETVALVKEMSHSGELDALVAERVWTEMSRALEEKTPSQFFYSLQKGQALEKLFPEIDALFGVPQTAKYHPEIDTGIHVMLALDKSAELELDVSARFAVLMHDLGKANTPTDILPSHHGHELRGIDKVKEFCHRWKAPKQFRQLALMTTQYHTHVHRAFELKASSLHDLLSATGALRQPEQFEKMLMACVADVRGRTGFEQKPYPQADFLRELNQTIRRSNVSSVIESGKTGQQLGEAIRVFQIALIRKFDKSPFEAKQETINHQ